MSWKDDKNLGPWKFIPQPNKYGYPNNPRWGKSFYMSDGTVLDPQVWNMKEINNEGGYIKDHHPCGHWHKNSFYTPGGGSGSALYIPWWSCPMSIVVVDGKLWFITADEGDPIATLTIREYNDGVWSDPFYIDTSEYDPLYVYDFQWYEPWNDSYSRNGITVISIFINRGADGSDPSHDILVFNGKNLLNSYSILKSVYGTFGVVLYDCGHYVYIDTTGRIHVIIGIYSGGIWSLYDLYSDDNGASFTQVLIRTPSYDKPCATISEDESTGRLWVHVPYPDGTTNFYVAYSDNNGASWTTVSSAASQSYVWDCRFFNDALYSICTYTFSGTTDVHIRRSVDGTSWSTVLTIPDERTSVNAAAIAYDGTYYYAMFCFKNRSGITVDRLTVYRSADGINWASVSEFEILIQGSAGQRTTTHFTVVGPGELFYSYYYASSVLDGYTTVYMLSVWHTVDYGVNWTVIQTPFYDLSSGTAPDGYPS